MLQKGYRNSLRKTALRAPEDLGSGVLFGHTCRVIGLSKSLESFLPHGAQAANGRGLRVARPIIGRFRRIPSHCA